MKRNQKLLIFALLLLFALSTYYYAAVYLPSVERAEAMRIQLERP